jgi:diguanylate cyclase (GGDEF)-like protein
VLTHSNATFLFASSDSSLLAAVEPVLTATGARVEIVVSAAPALAALAAARPLSLTLLDANLCSEEPWMNIGQLLAAAHSMPEARRGPIVLISDTVTEEWVDRLAEGIIDDLIARATEPAFLQLRLETVLRTHRITREFGKLCEAAALDAQTDRLTGVYNRETMLGMLFRETDRVQRMKSALCMVLFDIDDFGHWNSRLGAEYCDELLRQIVARTARLLRSYDLLGRVGKDEFLIALPGCSTVNAVMLAERLRLDVFCTPFHLGGESVRLSACFGIATSHGRSPVVVLREAEQALQSAKATGPESIECIGDYPQPGPSLIPLLTPSAGGATYGW